MRGATFSEARDGKRLREQYDVVRFFMLNGDWWTLEQLEAVTEYPQASISARIRDLRRDLEGTGKTVIGERVPGGNGLWRYRVR